MKWELVSGGGGEGAGEEGKEQGKRGKSERIVNEKFLFNNLTTPSGARDVNEEDE